MTLPATDDTPDAGRDLFDDSKVSWTPASNKYFQVKLLGGIIGWVIFLLLCCIPLAGNLLWDWDLWNFLVYGLPAVVLIWAVIDLSLTGRRVRALGYSEQPEHLLIKQGLLIRKVMAVPYGRMQYVEVNVGPIAQIFGLAELELHTAAANMTGKIVGITEDDAKRLRKVLTERGEEKMVAL